jgi:hypothetical protein
MSNGQGRYTWANGDYWEGEFRDDVKTDNGKMEFASRERQPGNTTGDAPRYEPAR